jgi:hypothetical protein
MLKHKIVVSFWMLHFFNINYSYVVYDKLCKNAVIIDLSWEINKIGVYNLLRYKDFVNKTVMLPQY